MIILKSNLSNTRPCNEFSLSLPPIRIFSLLHILLPQILFLLYSFCCLLWGQAQNKFSIKKAEHQRIDALKIGAGEDS